MYIHEHYTQQSRKNRQIPVNTGYMIHIVTYVSYVSVWVHIFHISMYMCIYIYIYWNMYTYVNTYIYIYIYIYLCTYVYTYIKTYIHMCIHVYILIIFHSFHLLLKSGCLGQGGRKSRAFHETQVTSKGAVHGVQ